MPKAFFKKYDLRGQVGKDFQINDIYGISRSIAHYFNQKDPNIKNIALAMDARIHSKDIKDQVSNAFLDSGFDVTFLGICPTPTLNFACNTLNLDAGIMVTASHNPKEDNGLKIIFHKESVWDENLQEIYQLYKQNSYIKSTKRGNYKEYDIIKDYVDFLADHFKDLKDFNINSIIDCGNGTAGTVLPQLFEKLNFQNTKLLFEEIDGTFPNHEPDPTVEKNLEILKKNLLSNEFEFGTGLDGDCDRFAVMSKAGNLIEGDKIIAIFSQFLSKKDKNNLVVVDIKCSNALTELLEKFNLKTIMTPTGFAYIKDGMKKNNGIFGGELSGHYCFKDRYFGFDDGIYSMLRFYEIMKKSGKKLEYFLEQFPKRCSSREIRIKCDDKENIINSAKKFFATKSKIEINDIDGIRIQTKRGWGILRASNTQDLLSLRFEGNTKEDLLKIKKDFFDAILPFFDEKLLKEQFDMN